MGIKKTFTNILNAVGVFGNDSQSAWWWGNVRIGKGTYVFKTNEKFFSIGLLECLVDLFRRHTALQASVAGRQNAAWHWNQMGCEVDHYRFIRLFRQRLLNLRRVSVGRDSISLHIFESLTHQIHRLCLETRTGETGFRIQDQSISIYQIISDQRRKRQDGSRRIATGIRDDFSRLNLVTL